MNPWDWLAIKLATAWDRPEAWFAAGGAAAWLADKWRQRVKDGHDRATEGGRLQIEGRKQSAAERDEAFDRLKEVVAELRTDMTGVKQELKDERELRRQAERDLESARKELRTASHELRNAKTALALLRARLARFPQSLPIPGHTRAVRTARAWRRKPADEPLRLPPPAMDGSPPAPMA